MQRAGEVEEIVGQSDIGTMLYAKKAGGTTFDELIEIKDTADTGGEPEQIDVSTMKRKVKVYVEGRKESPSQTFTYNYTENNYFKKVKPYCDGKIHNFLIIYPDGTGTLIIGSATTKKNGISLNSAIEATLTVTPIDIVDKTSEEVTALLATA